MARLAFWISAGACLVLLVLGWFVLPDRVPIHFGVGGDPDRWVDRTRAVLEMGAVVGGVALVFLLLAAGVRRVSPALINLPPRQKEWWTAEPARLERLRGMLAEDVLAMGAATLALLGGTLLLTGLTAYQEEPGLGWGVWALLCAYLLVLSLQVYRMMTVRYRPRE
ncbi:DUF1648 domain-containing protein [Ornithinicoccus hortensis]|uniref:Uncharacterized protein DUF1648 n=1 Tax=Ornithinicoccus hortensis TaxID=82346 RepID=A0A542YS30_9MICO|nr:DUF1648 domain-containing protein [Ornithinicoccus hortensis]TQL50905.1 uncharacterized protein DUF1648 [Ornithinicoccus hortensis]